MHFHSLATVCILLSACSSLVPATLMQVMALSPLQADPADIALRTSLPRGVGLIPDASFLTLAATNPARGLDVDHRFAIRTTEDAEGRLVFTLAPEAMAPLARLQEIVRHHEAEDPRGTTGSLGVTLGLCDLGTGIDPQQRLSVDLRTEAEGVFLPFVRNLPIQDATDHIGTLPPCTLAGADNLTD